jgi:hypothetical protein
MSGRLRRTLRLTACALVLSAVGAGGGVIPIGTGSGGAKSETAAADSAPEHRAIPNAAVINRVNTVGSAVARKLLGQRRRQVLFSNQGYVYVYNPYRPIQPLRQSSDDRLSGVASGDQRPDVQSRKVCMYDFSDRVELRRGRRDRQPEPTRNISLNPAGAKPGTPSPRPRRAVE